MKKAKALPGVVAVSENQGPAFGRPSNEDSNMLGSILGPLIFGNLYVGT